MLLRLPDAPVLCPVQHVPPPASLPSVSNMRSQKRLARGNGGYRKTWEDFPPSMGGAGRPDSGNPVLKPLSVNKQGQLWKNAWAVTLKPDGLQQYHRAGGVCMRGSPSYTCGGKRADHRWFP